MGVIERIMDDGMSPSDWRAVIEDRPLLVSVSGGKDSTAVVLWLREQGLFDRCSFVFADTGWEHPAVYQYLDEVLEPLCEGRLVRVSSSKYPRGMVDLVLGKAVFPQRNRRFCTEELKQKPIKEHIARLRADGLDVISVVGVRAAESVARSKLEMFDHGGPIGKDVDVWRPLIHWTVEQVIDIHNRNNIKPCSLYYAKGYNAKRVGCWPCISSRKAEIKAVADTTPERIDLIRELEDKVSKLRNQRVQARGEVLRCDRVTFFQTQLRGEEGIWDIDRAVAWSRTSRGGKQFEMFMTDTPGCQMWGLCDMGEQ